MCAYKEPLIWEQNADKYCEELKKKIKCIWVDGVLEIVRNKNISRNKFIKEFNQLKYLQKEPSTSEKNLVLSPSEVSNFKHNLKRSVLLSYMEVTKPQKDKEQKKVTSEIQTFSNILESKQSSRFPSDLFTPTNIGNIRNSVPLSNRKSLNKSRLKATKANLRESVINLVDDTMSSIFKGEQKQVSKLSAHALQIFVKFTVLLERHLTCHQHKICMIIDFFFESIYLKYGNKSKSKVTNQRKQSSTSEVDILELQSLIRDIKMFITLLAKMVQDFYNLHSFAEEDGINYLINNYENVVTVVTGIVFKNQNFYDFLLKQAIIFNRQKDSLVEAKFEALHGKPPNFFSVKREYCLNSITFKKYIEDMSSIESNIENLVPEELESSGEEPYLKCSQSLVKMAKSKTPVAKMKCIMQCAEKITQTIAEFYESNQMNIKNSMLDADQVLSIFCYILSMNRVPNIYAHMFIIEQFATEHQKISMSGYYFSVLECAIQENYGEVQDTPRYDDENNQDENKKNEDVLDEEFNEQTFNAKNSQTKASLLKLEPENSQGQEKIGRLSKQSQIELSQKY